MGLLTEIYGSSGLAFDFFGGQWWLVGLFIIFIFTVYLLPKGFSAEAMSLFLFSAFILVTIDGLFQIPSDWIIIIIAFITIIIGFSVNKWLRG